VLSKSSRVSFPDGPPENQNERTQQLPDTKYAFSRRYFFRENQNKDGNICFLTRCAMATSGGGDLQRGLQALTVATQLDAQLRYHEAVDAYRGGIALLWLAYGGT
jgi:hypothetical protein